MKEAKLKINVEGIVKACLSINAEKIIDVSAKSSDKLTHLVILDHILSDNLEIESRQHSKKEKKNILDVLKNNMYQCLIDNENEASTMISLHDALRDGKEEMIKFWSLSLANMLINPNPFIYNPNHGISRKNEAVEHIVLFTPSSDLSPRECTLELRDINCFNLESALQLTSESLDKEILCHVSNSISSIDMDIFKKHVLLGKDYSLSELYSLKKEKMLLVDYGLNLIRRKYPEIRRLIKTVKALEEGPNEQKHQIGEEILKVLTFEDMRILFSIMDNIEEVKKEKAIHNQMFKTFEYMANETSLLEESHISSPSWVRDGISEFYYKYISTDNGLEKASNKKKDELAEEIRVKNLELEGKEAEYSQKAAELKDYADANRADCDPHEYEVKEKEMKESLQNLHLSIEKIKHSLYALKFAEKKEKVQLDRNFELLKSVSFFSSQIVPNQKAYIYEKMNDFENMHALKSVEPGRFFSTKRTEREVIQILVLIISLTAVTAMLLFIFNHYPENKIIANN
ncbi:hypothetical protein NEMIN01_0657 [Nematocida minor]|uniref:uncharacterized protein n=1 Tax=Nematocida minor TaxID=1912983 RepID=UPI002220C0F3|nr:uncharacterized protein NEMIN01_0657 [Nematocida minor]KAI5189704.1 hypothetical protein NEMIN01_0657 [Nematocida minor]